MEIEPSLATSWEPLEKEDGWRFRLRRDVTFHGGETFTSDDVLFSYERAISETSDVTSWFAPVERVRVVDDYTIVFITTNPNPLFPDSITNFVANKTNLGIKVLPILVSRILEKIKDIFLVKEMYAHYNLSN